MPDLPHRRRRQRPAWTEPIVQRLTPAIKALVIVDALLFFLLLALYGRPAGAALEAHLGLGPGFFRGELWQPLTALFVHFPHSFLSFVFNLIGSRWRPKSYREGLGLNAEVLVDEPRGKARKGKQAKSCNGDKTQFR